MKNEGNTVPKYIFPENFLWGVATAAAQVEGAVAEDGRGPSIWDAFCHLPGSELDKPDVACDQYHHIEEDVALMKELGIKSYRFSFSWPRILPEGTGKVNPAGVAYYRKLIDLLKENGIVPCATMYHWDLPYALQCKGGFGNRKMIDWFLEYAKVLLDNFGADIPIWATFNEPIAVYVGHAMGIFAPGIRDEEYARQCLHDLLVCHGKAVQMFRSYNFHDAKIGIVVDVWHHYPARPGNAADEAMAMHRNEIEGYGMFLHPLFLGGWTEEMTAYLQEKNYTIHVCPGDFETIREPIDFYGLNFYNGLFDCAEEGNAPQDGDNGGNFQERRQPRYYYEALRDVLHMLVDKYHVDVPIYLTENGVPNGREEPDENGVVHDEFRIDYVRNVLKQLYLAVRDGIDVRGYYIWSLLDNFEWCAGYEPRYGIVRTDYETQKRTVKDSGRWYQQVIKENGFIMEG